MPSHICPYSGWRLYYPRRKTLLYFVEFTINQQKLYKLGITTQGIHRRFVREKHPYRILFYRAYRGGRLAYLEEQRLLKKYAHLKYDGEPLLINGNSELLTENIQTFERTLQ